MAGVRDSQLVQLGPWPAGINNVTDEKRLPRNEFGTRPVALREADNIDLDTAGMPTRRRGYTAQLADMTLAHSGWSDALVPFALLVTDGELCSLQPDLTLRPLGAYVGHQPLSYALIGSDIYYCNTIASGLLPAAGGPHRWAPEQPSGQPTLAAVDGLGLFPGQYQVAVTYTDDMGRESGTTLAAQVDVTEGQGIHATALPQPLDAATVLINIYLTDANDQVLRRHTSLPAVGITDLHIGVPATGKALDTQFLEPMPGGQITRLFNGRQLVARGRRLMWSNPLRYGMYNRARGVMEFHAPIDLVAPIGREGVMVAAGDRTIWLGGAEPSAWTRDIAYGAGAVPGSHLEVPGVAFATDGDDDTSPSEVWLARDGQLVRGTAGRVSPMKFDSAVIDGADRAAPLYRSEGGLQQLVMGLRAPQRQALAVTDTAVAHVIRGRQ